MLLSSLNDIKKLYANYEFFFHENVLSSHDEEICLAYCLDALSHGSKRDFFRLAARWRSLFLSLNRFQEVNDYELLFKQLPSLNRLDLDDVLSKKPFLKEFLSEDNIPYRLILSLKEIPASIWFQQDSYVFVVYEDILGIGELFNNLKVTHTIFFFRHQIDFFKAFADPYMKDILQDSCTSIFFLDSYLHPQFFEQLENVKDIQENLSKIVLDKVRNSLLRKALESVVYFDGNPYRYSTVTDNIYKMAIEEKALRELQRLRNKDILSWIWKWQNVLWMDPRKELFWDNSFLDSYLRLWIEENPLKPTKNRNLDLTKKRKIVHVAAQMVKGNHAPSRRIRKMIQGYDRCDIEAYLLLSEHLVFHCNNYPFSSRYSKRSLDRDSDLHKIIDNIIEAPETLSLKEKGPWLLQELENIQPDIVFFHGDHPLHLWLSHYFNGFKVFVEHGSYPDFCHFDGYLLGYEEEKPILEKRLKISSGKIFCNPVSFDESNYAQSEFFNKNWLGIHSNEFILTTVSYHFAHRLSWSMCEIIAKVLSKYTHVYYMPIGKVDSFKELGAIFSYYDVADRVLFLGSVKDPTAYLRCMDIYLNEFPFGGGLACMDAIAAKVPIVSMFVDKGPMQARQGSYWMGKEFRAHSYEEYERQISHLIENSQEYARWKAKATEVYFEIEAKRNYQKKHQEIVKEMLILKEGIL